MTAPILSAALSLVSVAVCAYFAVDAARRARWNGRHVAAMKRVYAVQDVKDRLIGDMLAAWERGDKAAVAVALPALDNGHDALMEAIDDWQRVLADAPGEWPWSR